MVFTDRADGSRPCTSSRSTKAGSGSDGAPVALLRLRRGGRGVLNLLDSKQRQILVRRGGLAGRAAPMGPWSLVARWCSPAFRDKHFTSATPTRLTTAFPAFANEIRALTRETAPRRPLRDRPGHRRERRAQASHRRRPRPRGPRRRRPLAAGTAPGRRRRPPRSGTRPAGRVAHPGSSATSAILTVPVTDACRRPTPPAARHYAGPPTW